MAVRIEFWMSKFCCDALLKALGDEVFKPFGLLMDFLNGVIEHLVEEGLYQPMVAQHFERTASPFRRKANTAMFFVLHVGLRSRSKLLQHVRDGCRRDSQALRKGSA